MSTRPSWSCTSTIPRYPGCCALTRLNSAISSSPSPGPGTRSLTTANMAMLLLRCCVPASGYAASRAVSNHSVAGSAVGLGDLAAHRRICDLEVTLDLLLDVERLLAGFEAAHQLL